MKYEKGETVSYNGKKVIARDFDFDGGQVFIEQSDGRRYWVNFDWLDKEGS